ncbi:MAG: hypothetical protein ACE5GH_04475 [Fidelibacterota bacterium]
MKTARFVPLATVGLLVTSCLIKSIHPWYDGNTTIFESSLLGKWINREEGISMNFIQKGDVSYEVEYVDSGDTSQFMVHLTTIKNGTYLDYEPVAETAEDFSGELVLRLHSLMKIEMTENALVIRPVNYDRMKTKARAGELEGVRYQFIDDDLILTSSTPVLRKFVGEHGHETEFFDEPLRLSLQQ